MGYPLIEPVYVGQIQGSDQQRDFDNRPYGPYRPPQQQPHQQFQGARPPYNSQNGYQLRQGYNNPSRQFAQDPRLFNPFGAGDNWRRRPGYANYAPRDFQQQPQQSQQPRYESRPANYAQGTYPSRSNQPPNAMGAPLNSPAGPQPTYNMAHQLNYNAGPQANYHADYSQKPNANVPSAPRSTNNEERRPSKPLNYQTTRPTAQGASQMPQGLRVNIIRTLQKSLDSSPVTPNLMQE